VAVFQSGTLATLASGSDVATDLVAGKDYQWIKRKVGAAGAVADFLDKSSRSDTFTATGNGTTIDVSAQAFSKFALQVKETGTVTSWTMVLEASLDNVTFTTVLKHMKTGDGSEHASGTGKAAFSGPNAYPALYFRARCEEFTIGAGTNVVANILGIP